MDLARTFGVLGEERKDVRSADGEHASVIASRHLDVLMCDLQLLHFLNPESRTGNGDQCVHVALHDDRSSLLLATDMGKCSVERLRVWDHDIRP